MSIEEVKRVSTEGSESAWALVKRVKQSTQHTNQRTSLSLDIKRGLVPRRDALAGRAVAELPGLGGAEGVDCWRGRG